MKVNVQNLSSTLFFPASVDNFVNSRYKIMEEREEFGDIGLNADLDYDPKHFLRCHSKKNDGADVQTQVWQCAFEPDKTDKSKTTKLVATCGGNSICFINVETGNIPLKYYAKDNREMFYALAWTTNGKDTFLASGGIRYAIHFIHPASGTAFYQKTIRIMKGNTHINCLLFHPNRWDLLLSGDSVGEVLVSAIQRLTVPELEMNLHVLRSFSASSEVFSMSFCAANNMLLVGCEHGLKGFKFPDDIEHFEDYYDQDRTAYSFTFPKKNKNQGEDLVDSVEVVGPGIIATKCALHEAIYMWNLTSALQAGSVPDLISNKTTVYNTRPTHVLQWSDTDNYYMYIGAQIEAGLMCCGDDKGHLWLYNLKTLGPSEPSRHLEVIPTLVIPWPILHDPHAEKKRKLSIDTYDIVIAKVAISSDGKYIVAVTNKNMVCIWYKCNE